MTSNQHSGAARPGQMGWILGVHLTVWSCISFALYWLGHGALDLGIWGPVTGGVAWALLAAAEFRVQPMAPQTVAAEDSPWRVAASWLLFTVVPVSAWDARLMPLTYAGGVVFITIGGGLRWWSLKTLGPLFTWTTGLVAEHELVRRGPYRFLKHPNYLGSVLFAAGIALASGSRLGWVPVTALAIAVFLAARHESAYLRGRLPGYR